MTLPSKGLALLLPLAACHLFTSLDEYGSGSGRGGAGVGASTGSSGGGTGAGGAASVCANPDACTLPGCKSCSTDPQVCDTNVATDPKNCGDCGHSCQGGACIGGTCQPLVLAPSRDRPAGVTIDATSVYWLDQGSGSSGKVLSVPRSGGTINELATQLQSPLNVVIDDQTVFFTFFTGGGGIARVDKNATGFKQLTPSSGPWAISSSAGDAAVYWTSSDGTVRKIDKAGGTVVPLATSSGVPRGIVVDDTSAYWTEACAPSTTSCAVGAVRKASKVDGSGPVDLAVSQASPIAVAVDAQYVYWINAGTSGATDCTSNDGSVWRADRISGAGAVELAKTQLCPQSIAIDAARVYWTNAGSYTGTSYNGDGNVSSVPIDGGATTVHASNLALPFGIALDGASVYWTESGVGPEAGALKKLAL